MKVEFAYYETLHLISELHMNFRRMNSKLKCLCFRSPLRSGGFINQNEIPNDLSFHTDLGQEGYVYY